MRVRVGGYFGRLSDRGFRDRCRSGGRCRNPFAERVIVAGLEDGAGWFEDVFGLELANYLWGNVSPDQQTNMYVPIGFTMLVVSLGVSVGG